MIIFTRDLDFVLPELDMHQAATPSNKQDVATSAKIDIEQHKSFRKIVSLIIVASAVIITL